jgi:hypothetical protein
MIRKLLGSGMMVGLVLLMGCADAPEKYNTNACSLPRFGAAQSHASAGKQWEPAHRRIDAADGAPAPAGQAAVGPPKPTSPSSLPEAVGLSVPTQEMAAEEPRSVSSTPETEKKEPQSSVAAEKPVARSLENIPVPPSPQVALQTASTETTSGVAQASWKVPPAGASDVARAEDAATGPQRSGADSAAEAALKPAHAADYSWLTGELEHLLARNVWRLRYAPFDQEDRHGGTVVLIGEALPVDCKSGQIVHVEGQLVNPDSDEPRPTYWVRSFRVLKAAPPDAGE